LKLLTATGTNFASYKNFDFDYSGAGLSLIYGATGSGKSTMLDIATWTLFGITAKGGSVDDVRSWQHNGEPTTVSLKVQTPLSEITVYRVRGSSKQNDLYWVEGASQEPHRGKNVVETQRLLEERLGVSSDTFLNASYFNEFSKTGQFFTAKAKDRRTVLEDVADLTLPQKIADSASSRRKEAREELAKAQAAYQRVEGRISQLEASLASLDFDIKAWAQARAQKEIVLQQKIKSFDTDKSSKIKQVRQSFSDWEEVRNASIDEKIKEIESLEANLPDAQELTSRVQHAQKEKCPTCGAFGNQELLIKAQVALETLKVQQRAIDAQKNTLERLAKAENPYARALTQAEALENHYEEQLTALRQEPNPYLSQKSRNTAELMKAKAELTALDAGQITAAEKEIAALTQLYDLSATLRAELLRKAVEDVQDETNRYLETYFDAELRVGFEMGNSDNLDVVIHKSGNECSYTQLSKGQRQLLRLSFSLAVQAAAANKAGVHFDNLFFDEALDGLDSSLKVKAYNLFEELASKHGSVFLIDHSSELQAMFDNRFHIQLVGDYSQIERENE